MTVVVDEPKMKAGLTGYGGTVAAPAFQNLGKKIIAYLGLKPIPSKEKTLAQGSRSSRSAL